MGKGAFTHFTFGLYLAQVRKIHLNLTNNIYVLCLCLWQESLQHQIETVSNQHAESLASFKKQVFSFFMVTFSYQNQTHDALTTSE